LDGLLQTHPLEAQEKIGMVAGLRQALEMNGHIYSKQKEWGAIGNLEIL